MSTLKARITEDMKNALRAKETARLGAIRLLLAAMKQREVDERITLDDTGVVAVVEKMLKQRKDSVQQYEQAGRTDLADREKAEMAILAGYLPQQLPDAELDAIVSAAVAGSGAKAPSDMGKVMAIVKPKVAGRADMGKVSALVKAKLAG
jgi:uncharacterized protein YqeY